MVTAEHGRRDRRHPVGGPEFRPMYVTAPEPTQDQVHKPIPIRLIIVLAAIAYCIPANPLAILPGAPLGILGGTMLIVLIAAAIAIERRIGHGTFWLPALALLAIARWSSGAL